MKRFKNYDPIERIKRLRRAAVVVLLVTAVIACVAFYLGQREMPIICMGIKLLTEEEFAEYTPADGFDVTVTLNGQPAPLDVEQSALYVTQTVTAETTLTDLEGTLGVDDGYTLFFAPDPALDDLDSAVREGHAFTLLVIDEAANYTEFKLIFTTLPVMKLDGSFTGVNDEKEDTYSGSVCLWWADDPSEEGYSVKSSGGEWHLRGDSVKARPKKAWKLSLKEEDGDNRDLSFLGMGSDDDWILNPMARDDLNLREKYAMALWERMRSDADTPVAMSLGEYVEVVQDGEYQGLYLLQRRIDRKFLGLGYDDILLKAKSTYAPASIRDAYEVIYSMLGEEYAYEVATPYYTDYDAFSIDLDHWIDLELLIQIGHMVDNVGLKNTYFLWLGDESERKMVLIPWDTDMSFGIVYENGFKFRDDLGEKGEVIHREEYDAMVRQYPALDRMIAERWQALRGDRLQFDSLRAIALGYREDMSESGALARDAAKWGQYVAKGADTIDQFLAYLEQRLSFLDAYYADILAE